MEGKTQEAASAAAGMSTRSASEWRSGPLPSESRPARTWRTREDPFAEVWDKELVPLLKADAEHVLDATILLSEVESRHPGRFGPHHLRTLQRRIRDWRAVFGAPREVFFEQTHPPGLEGAVDFTDGTELGITIRGVLLNHKLFEFVLSCSTWTWIDIAYSETYEALAKGVQGALWDLGGVPAELRSDNLSAATHELRRSGGRALTSRFKAVLDHYRMRSTRIRPGQAHENGGVESRHRITKRLLAQALVLRGSHEFQHVDDYLAFARQVVDEQHNRKIAPRLEAERAHLRPLPPTAIPSHSSYRPTVRKWSTIRVMNCTYSVPSRLIGHEVEARVHASTVEVWFKGHLVEAMPRLRGAGQHRVDYRHIIWSLVKKPGAFARYRFREELFPSAVFRAGYDRLRSSHGDRADIEYVKILHLAASTMQSDVERAIGRLLESSDRFDYVAVKQLFAPEIPSVPAVEIPAPDLRSYDRLLTGVSS